ncbi:MAG: peroxiredoxin [Planctomycetaceae bacterium]|nr:peroxiredoxin [Planctomycetaceae bacterium]
MKRGDVAPDFELANQNGTMVRLSAIAPGKTMVVFFYPKDGSPVCTKEACAFRDSQRAFTAYNAQVVGISSDSADSHRRFAAGNHLDYPLLSDAGGKVRKLWGVPSTLGVLPGRVTYVLDAKGVVRDIYSAQLEASSHVHTALEAVKKLHSPDAATPE